MLRSIRPATGSPTAAPHRQPVQGERKLYVHARRIIYHPPGGGLRVLALTPPDRHALLAAIAAAGKTGIDREELAKKTGQPLDIRDIQAINQALLTLTQDVHAGIEPHPADGRYRLLGFAVRDAR